MTDLNVWPLQLGQVGGLELRYGENGWQNASLFTQFSDDPLELGKFVLEEGEMPSQTNLTDLDRGVMTLTHIIAALKVNAPTPTYPRLQAALAIKHGNCCGAGYNYDPERALYSMLAGDRNAILGALLIFTFPITAKMAEALLYAIPLPGQEHQRRIFDVVVAPSFDPKAVEMLRRKNGKCRFITNPALKSLTIDSLDSKLRTRAVRGGHLVQDSYAHQLDFRDPRVAVYGNDRRGNDGFVLDLAFASAICRTSNSNTVTIVHENMLVGNGVGQTRRDRASRLAVSIAAENGHLEHIRRYGDAVAVSDSFFPFADGITPLIDAGVEVIFATSGAMRDREIQQTCIQRGVTLYQLPDKDARMFFGH